MKIADLTTQHYVHNGVPDFHKRMQELEAEHARVSELPREKPPHLGDGPRGQRSVRGAGDLGPGQPGRAGPGDLALLTERGRRVNGLRVRERRAAACGDTCLRWGGGAIRSGGLQAATR
jgi:hypothetical protein